MPSTSLLYPKESFRSNFKTATKKIFHRRRIFHMSNFQLIPICYYVNKRTLNNLNKKKISFYCIIYI